MKKQILILTLILIGAFFSCSDSAESKALSISELENLIDDPKAEEILLKKGYQKLSPNEGFSRVTNTYGIGKKETNEGKSYWSQMVDKHSKRPGIGYSITDEKIFLEYKNHIMKTGEDKGKRRRSHLFVAENGNNFAFQIDSTKKDIPTTYRILIEKPLK
jgi:hypothetical protein